ncbi:hypothetical protein [Arthrobacter sp. 4R501]|uniref:hypothetical protein n=1 Tax=Arthrobacter sp. 4R501 TaxID=2058886 RepID=UPI0011B05EB4|nr:hypothetical protein [Arthrobacter sp. 4R501]
MTSREVRKDVVRGSLRERLDSDSQLLYDEVTAKYLRPGARTRPTPIVSAARWAARKEVEECFRAFVRALGSDEQVPVRNVLADPQFRLRAWQQVREWDRDRESGAWALREKTEDARYRPRAMAVRALYALAVVLGILGVVIDGWIGVAWAGLAVFVAGSMLYLFSLPRGGLNYPLWQVHTEAIAKQRSTDASSR